MSQTKPHTNRKGPSLLSDRFSGFLPPRRVNSVGREVVPVLVVCSSTARPLTPGAELSADGVGGNIGASTGGSKVSLRKADRLFFACGNFTDSSEP